MKFLGWWICHLSALNVIFARMTIIVDDDTEFPAILDNRQTPIPGKVTEL